MTKIYDQVGKRMKQAREAARGGIGFSQKAIAVMLGVSYVTVCRWETGKRFPTIRHLEQFANIVNKPLTYFVDEHVPRPPDESPVKNHHSTQEDWLKTVDIVMEAMQGWNGIENCAESKSVTINFDSHEQARQFARNFGHLLWLAWAISEAKKINVADYLDEKP